MTTRWRVDSDVADGSLSLDFGHELVVDLFAGGGGASMGIGAAYREPDIAVNHNAIAVAVHRANHPRTRHFTEDVFDVDPVTVTKGRPVGLLWASPDCRHHSKAKGGAPRNKRIRGLAWVVVRWALEAVPRRILIENVEEFIDWCPLDEAGNPIRSRQGETFRAFISAMTTGLAADHPAMAELVEFLGDRAHVPALVRGLGYTADWREIRACNKGAPTIRKRLLIKFSRDKTPIAWSRDTHAKNGAGGLKAWRTAAECIDFTLPSKSIFNRARPLARNTCRRIAKGLWRYVLACDTPYLVGGQAACLTEFANASNQRVFAANEPLRTQVAQVKGGHFALVSAYLVKYYGNDRDGVSLSDPMHTLPTKDRMGLVQVEQVRADSLPPEQLAAAERCADFLHEHLPAQFPEPAGIVLVRGHVLVDITLRMLVPTELARAQGFHDGYILDRGLFETFPGSGEYEWKPVSKTDQVRLIGNSVCPDVAEAEVRTDLADLIALYEGIAA